MILHIGALGYSAGYVEYIFGDGFGQYLHMLDIDCEPYLKPAPSEPNIEAVLTSRGPPVIRHQRPLPPPMLCLLYPSHLDDVSQKLRHPHPNRAPLPDQRGVRVWRDVPVPVDAIATVG
jgi:hypothetical protein